MKGVHQHDERDCGIACIVTLCKYYGINVPMSYVRNIAYLDKNGLSMLGMIQIFQDMNFKAVALKGSCLELLEEIAQKKKPLVALIMNESLQNHYVVIKGIKRDKVLIFDPAIGNKAIKIKEFNKIWSGYIVEVEKGENWKCEKLKKETNKYFNIIKMYKKSFCLVLIFSIFISVLMMLAVQLYQFIIDNYILGIDGKKSILNINYLSEIKKFLQNTDKVFLLYIIVNILSNVSYTLRDILLAQIEKGVGGQIKNLFIDKALKLPIRYFNDRDSGEVINRYDSIEMITEALANAAISIFLEIFMLTISGIVLYSIDKRLFSIVVIIAIVYIFLVFIYKKPLNILTKQCMDQDAQITTMLKQDIDGLESIKSLCAENTVRKKLLNTINDNINNIYKINILRILLSSLITGVESIAIIIILFLGSQMVVQGIMTVGTLIMFESFLDFFINPVKSLTEMLPSLQETYIAFERLDDVFNAESEENLECKNYFEIDEQKIKISVNHLYFKYGYGNEIIQDISFEIHDMEKVFFIGESGSGKSTLAKLLVGLMKPTNGNIYINQKNIFDININTLRNTIIYTSQNIMIFSETLKYNITMGEKITNVDEFQKILEVCGIHEIMAQRKWTLNNYISENGRNLSEGEKQRIAICRSLLRTGKIYIFDEATSHLDKKLENQIMQYIFHKLDNKICIFIMHCSDYLEKADYIYVLENGCIVEKGEYSQLMRDGEKCKKIMMLG